MAFKPIWQWGYDGDDRFSTRHFQSWAEFLSASPSLPELYHLVICWDSTSEGKQHRLSYTIKRDGALLICFVLVAPELEATIRQWLFERYPYLRIVGAAQLPPLQLPPPHYQEEDDDE